VGGGDDGVDGDDSGSGEGEEMCSGGGDREEVSEEAAGEDMAALRDTKLVSDAKLESNRRDHNSDPNADLTAHVTKIYSLEYSCSISSWQSV
jgi:hypothetical protein